MGVTYFHWSQYHKTSFSVLMFLLTPGIFEPEGKCTTPQLIESPPPHILTPTFYPETQKSQQCNLLFASVGVLTPSPNPVGYVDHYSDENAKVAGHYPVQIDPTLAMNNVWVSIFAIRCPLLIELTAHSDKVRESQLTATVDELQDFRMSRSKIADVSPNG